MERISFFVRKHMVFFFPLDISPCSENNCDGHIMSLALLNSDAKILVILTIWANHILTIWANHYNRKMFCILKDIFGDIRIYAAAFLSRCGT